MSRRGKSLSHTRWRLPPPPPVTLDLSLAGARVQAGAEDGPHLLGQLELDRRARFFSGRPVVVGGKGPAQLRHALLQARRAAQPSAGKRGRGALRRAGRDAGVRWPLGRRRLELASRASRAQTSSPALSPALAAQAGANKQAKQAALQTALPRPCVIRARLPARLSLTRAFSTRSSPSAQPHAAMARSSSLSAATKRRGCTRSPVAGRGSASSTSSASGNVRAQPPRGVGACEGARSLKCEGGIRGYSIV